jgi:hypothetical protein
MRLASHERTAPVEGQETVEGVTVPDDPLDVASMSREQRDALKRELLSGTRISPRS